MSHSERLLRLRAELPRQEIDAMLITSEVNVHYLTGFTGDSTYLLVHPDGEWLLSDRRYETQLQTECGDTPALVRGPERTMLHLVEEAFGKLGAGSRVGLEAEHLSWAGQQQMAPLAKNCDLKPTSQVVEKLRWIKDASEIAILRRAVWIAERTFEALRARLRPGWTELEMAHEVEATMRQLGASGCGFSPILAIDANAALPHAHPGKQTLGDAEVLLIDWGAKYHGYTSDLTRTLSVGPPSKKFGEVYHVVLEAQRAAIAAMAPGVRLADIDAAARNVIKSAGYGDFFGHGLGHGIGLEIHENPRMASIAEGTLEAGMVVTVEPGIYLPGQFGVRIEDDVLITAGGHEVLSVLPKGLEDCSVIL